MPSQRRHLDTTPVVRNVRRLTNRQNLHKCVPLGKSHHPPAKRRVSEAAAERDTSQRESSVPSTIQGQNSTPLSLLNSCRVADIAAQVASTPSATQRRSIDTPTATPVTISRSSPAPGGTLQKDSMHGVVCSPASGIASTHTSLSGLKNLPTPIPNPESHMIITNPLKTRATERNQRQRQLQLQLQAVSTPRSIVSCSRSLDRFDPSDMTYLVFVTGRFLELYMRNRLPFSRPSDMETVSYAMRRIVKALADAS